MSKGDILLVRLTGERKPLDVDWLARMVAACMRSGWWPKR